MSGRSERNDLEIALDIIGAAALLGPIVAKGVREVIEAARPDLRLADPPPDGQRAAIEAEDDAVIRRRFGGGGSER
jgi:hypothetical protein